VSEALPQIHRRTIVVDGLATSFLETGSGPDLVLLHGGEFGSSAELGWERNIAALATHHHVLAVDQLGYGQSAKVIDFNDGRRMRIRHVARFCELVGVQSADFVGNSMGAVNLLVDASSAQPLLPVRRMVVICGGGEILRNPHSDALFEYDGTFEAMRLIVAALFHDPSYPADERYVRRRYESSLAPGAWEAIAAARFRRPGPKAVAAASEEPAYGRISVPTLLVEGGGDKLKPAGWAAHIAAQVPEGRSCVIDDAGHCPQIERPEVVNRLVLGFLSGAGSAAPARSGDAAPRRGVAV
jgi:pimeloyl-ACP methyl ester carboxylesterase